MGNNKFLDLCMEKGLRVDHQSGNLYGVRGGYHVCMVLDNMVNNQYAITFSVNLDGAAPDQFMLQQAVKASKPLSGVTAAGYQVVFFFRVKGLNGKKIVENAGNALDEAIGILRSLGYQDCCQGCGSVTATATCMVGGSFPAHLCQDCYNAKASMVGQQQQRESQKQENVVAGIVGALLGSLVGVLAIILFSQLGVVAAVSGVIMAVCTLKGYELLGGKITKKSVIACVLVMLVMVYVGDRLDWAIVVMRDLGELGIGFFDAFRAVPALLSEGLIESGAYYGNLALIYLFAALGAAPTIMGRLKKKARENAVYVMN